MWIIEQLDYECSQATEMIITMGSNASVLDHTWHPCIQRNGAESYVHALAVPVIPEISDYVNSFPGSLFPDEFLHLKQNLSRKRME